MKTKNYCALLFLLLQPYLVHADNQLSDWSIKGFGTLALTGTDTDKLGFYRDKSQTQDADSGWGITPDSQFGVQLDWKINDDFQTTVQWIARDHAGDFFEQNLDWAYLRWSVADDLDLRFGRIGIGMFTMSDYRNIGYAYPWIRPPHEFYNILPYYHFDGADITKKFFLDDGYLTIKAYGGYSYNQLPTQTSGIHNQHSPATGAMIRYEEGDWMFRAGYTFAAVTSNPPIQDILTPINSPYYKTYWPSLQSIVPMITMRGKEYHFVTLGINYDDGDWLSQFETSYTRSNIVWSPSRVNGYWGFGRRFSDITLFSLLGFSKSFEDTINVPNPLVANRDLMANKQRLNYALNHTAINEQSTALGVRWDFYTNMDIKAQWDHYWLGQHNGTQHWQQSLGTQNPNEVNVMSVAIDFIF